jgi:multiple sugar transport system ATP-binding protein
MTVAETMAFSLRLAGVPKAKRYERAREVAHVLQLEPLLNRKPKELSGGQRQRVGNWSCLGSQSQSVFV